LQSIQGQNPPRSYHTTGEQGYLIQNWLKVLRDDKRFIVSAAGKAEKAVDLILNKQ